MWPDNWPAWQVFHDCTTQWRVAPLGGLMGLDYTAVKAVIEIRRLPYETFHDVRVIERGALQVIQENDGA